MTILRLIGDIHCNFDIWKNELIKGSDLSVQVGDFGIGFPKADGSKTSYPAEVDHKRHRFIRGNHDDPNLCHGLNGYIHDGHTERLGSTRIMYIGGALSIDKDNRIQGFDYWEDEELSYTRLEHMIDMYCSWKPNLVVTHECPEWISNFVALKTPQKKKYNIQSRTRNAFDIMWEEYKPDAWYFGHWHTSYQEDHRGTHFRCLNINEWEDIRL